MHLPLEDEPSVEIGAAVRIPDFDVRIFRRQRQLGAPAAGQNEARSYRRKHCGYRQLRSNIPAP